MSTIPVTASAFQHVGYVVLLLGPWTDLVAWRLSITLGGTLGLVSALAFLRFVVERRRAPATEPRVELALGAPDEPAVLLRRVRICCRACDSLFAASPVRRRSSFRSSPPRR